MDQLKKLKDKKGMSKMHPIERKAKMGVMEDMRNMADDAMGNKLKGLNKVTVASDSPQGLRHGLSKAQDMMPDGSDDAQMLAMGGEADPMEHMPPAFDDTHPDHENFLASHNGQDGDDGMDAYPDADGDHLLEMDEAAKHAEDETEEKGEMYAEGGNVAPDEHPEGMPNYDDMDAGEMSAHLNELVAALKKKGLA